MASTIYILPADHLDKKKWDRLIHNSPHGLIYATTSHLDAMCDQWHGLVIDDYRAVMPVPWRKRLRFRYAYMPAFTQQLGLIGGYTVADLKAAVHKLHQFVALADIHFNFANTDLKSFTGGLAKTNLVIDLAQSITELRTRYKTDLRENINKAAASGLQFERGEQIRNAIDLYQKNYSERIPQLKEKDFQRFAQLCALLAKNGQCFTRAVADEGNNILSIGLFLKDNKRIYNLMNTTLPEGRKREANHLLLDSVLDEFSQQPLLFDFEGSELPGVKDFYEKFGAVNQPYFFYHYNALPWPLNLWKR